MIDTSPRAYPEAIKGAIAGLVAGLVASWVMDRFQSLTSTLVPSDDGEQTAPATEQAADRLTQAVSGTPLPDDRKPAGGQAVHYATGALLGLGYGIAAEFRPSVTVGAGTAFGTATALLLDETAVPAAGLGKWPWRTPATTQLYSLTSHLVFGAAAEITRRMVRRAIG